MTVFLKASPSCLRLGVLPPPPPPCARSRFSLQAAPEQTARLRLPQGAAPGMGAWGLVFAVSELSRQPLELRGPRARPPCPGCSLRVSSCSRARIQVFPGEAPAVGQRMSPASCQASGRLRRSRPLGCPGLGETAAVLRLHPRPSGPGRQREVRLGCQESGGQQPGWKQRPPQLRREVELEGTDPAFGNPTVPGLGSPPLRGNQA